GKIVGCEKMIGNGDFSKSVGNLWISQISQVCGILRNIPVFARSNAHI
ncbi:30438_t:CDS:1, partial [Racocetra persica]